MKNPHYNAMIKSKSPIITAKKERKPMGMFGNTEKMD